MSLPFAPLHPRLGCIVERRNGEELDSLATSEVVELLAAHGVVLFRDYAPSRADFIRFSDKFALHPRDLLRSARDVAKYDPGEVGLHSDGAAFPTPNEHLWLFCEKPASSGGATMLCDGIAVYENLAPDLRDELLNERIVVEDRDSDRWKLMRFERRGANSHEKVLHDLREITGGWEFECWFEGDSLCTRFMMPIIRRTRFTSQPAFVNNICYQTAGTVRRLLRRGTPMPQDLLRQILEAVTPQVIEVSLMAGDVLFVDNSRMLHGRRNYSDVSRLVYAREQSSSPV